MDTPGGGEYWGKVGMDPEWDAYWAKETRDPEDRPARILRYSGAGHYAGVLIVLLGAFAVAQSFCKDGGVLGKERRRWVWFWSVAAVLSVLLAFGRFAPFYRLVFALPYFNSIRNPVKFLHPFNVALVVLFAYGFQALWEGWIANRTGQGAGAIDSFRKWWQRGTTWERRWTVLTLAVCGLSALGWLIYGSRSEDLERYLAEVGFAADDASSIYRFSKTEVGLFVIVLILSVFLLLAVMSGWLGGRKWLMGVGAMGALMVADLSRADAPWIVYFNWKSRYQTNPIFDLLRSKPFEGRVTGRMPLRLAGQGGQLQQALEGVWGVEWLQHEIPYYDIQALDIVQMPRTPIDYAEFTNAVFRNVLREWELTNTRYILTLAPIVPLMNEHLDPVHKRFQLAQAFSLSQTGQGYFRVETNANGPFGLVEFTGALPRAKLFGHWRGGVPDAESLRLIGTTNFNPQQDVLIADSVPSAIEEPVSVVADQALYENYSPKKFSLNTKSTGARVLLVNDKFDPDWRVYVDGAVKPLLRANYIMRGVYLDKGNHRVEFRFEPPAVTLWVSGASMALSLAILGYALWIDGGGMRRTRPC